MKSLNFQSVEGQTSFTKIAVPCETYYYYPLLASPWLGPWRVRTRPGRPVAPGDGAVGGARAPVGWGPKREVERKDLLHEKTKVYPAGMACLSRVC